MHSNIVPSPLWGEGAPKGRVMGAGGHLGLRQHVDAAGRAQRHDSAGAKYKRKIKKQWFFAFE